MKDTNEELLALTCCEESTAEIDKAMTADTLLDDVGLREDGDDDAGGDALSQLEIFSEDDNEPLVTSSGSTKHKTSCRYVKGL